MENGSIVIVVLPQADGVPKNRPALVLCRLEPFGDYLVAGISSQLHRTIENTDEIIPWQVILRDRFVGQIQGGTPRVASISTGLGQTGMALT